MVDNLIYSLYLSTFLILLQQKTRLDDRSPTVFFFPELQQLTLIIFCIKIIIDVYYFVKTLTFPSLRAYLASLQILKRVIIFIKNKSVMQNEKNLYKRYNTGTA